MSPLVIHASPRSTSGKVVDHLRRARKIPAVVYGHGIKTLPLEIQDSEFQRVYREAGRSSLVGLVVNNEAPVNVLIHEVQKHPTRHNVLHVDFYQVRMTEKIEAEIDLVLEGESPAVKEQGGVLVRALDKLKVTCLPGDLVPSITVPIDKIKTFEDRIHLRDLVLPPGVQPLIGGDEVVVSVTPPRSEEELKSLSGEVTENVEEVEVEKKGKPEEAAAVEESSDTKKEESS